MKSSPAYLLSVALVVLTLSTAALAAEPLPVEKAATPAGKARHEVLTTAAWAAFEKKDYAGAIARAEQCLDDFAPAALRMQKKLEAEEAVIPEGNVSESELKRIFANGLLNDVAACLYVKGLSAEKLNRAEEAEKAYQQGSWYTHARVWNEPEKSFWAVAEVCEVRARALRLPPKEREDLLAELEMAPHERETKKAWDAFNRQDYRTAIEHADKCIKRFSRQAQQLQDELTKAGVRVPVGSVTEAKKKKIFANGVLNDVATCLFIKGRCAERLGRAAEAKEHYAAATKLTHARCWDEQGWFWSVSEAATDRMEILKLP